MVHDPTRKVHVYEAPTQSAGFPVRQPMRASGAAARASRGGGGSRGGVTTTVTMRRTQDNTSFSQPLNLTTSPHSQHNSSGFSSSALRRSQYPNNHFRGNSAPAAVTLGGTMADMAPIRPIGAMGGQFSSSSRFKTIRLPSIRSMPDSLHRGVRVQSLYSQRWIVVPPEDRGDLPPATPLTVEAGTDQEERWAIGQETQHNSRTLTARAQTAWSPYNEQSAYLLVGNRMTAHSRRQMEEQELIRLERNGLVPAPELYFGRGFGSEPKAVRLRQLRKRTQGMSPDGPGSLPPTTAEAEAGAEGGDGGDQGAADAAPALASPDSSDNGAAVAAAAAADGNGGAPATAATDAANNAATPAADDADVATPLPSSEPNAAAAGAGAAGAWAGTPMEGVETKANRRKTFTEYLVKNSESAPSKLDIRNYQLRELYNGASEESVKNLSNSFMAADTNGNGEISYNELKQHILDKCIGTIGTTVVTLAVNNNEEHLITTREYVAVLDLARELQTRYGSAEDFKAIEEDERDICAAYTEGFYAADKKKEGKITGEDLRLMITAIIGEGISPVSKLNGVLDELEKAAVNGKVSYHSFMIHFPAIFVHAV